MVQMRHERFVERFIAWKKDIKLSNYRIEKDTGYSRANLTNLEKGLIGPSDELLEKLSDAYELPLETLKSWRLLDEYPAEVIREAMRYLDENPDFKKSAAMLVEQYGAGDSLKQIQKKD